MAYSSLPGVLESWRGRGNGVRASLSNTPTMKLHNKLAGYQGYEIFKIFNVDVKNALDITKFILKS